MTQYPCRTADGREDKWLKSELKITSLLRALSEDLKSNVQEPVLLLKFARERLMKSLLLNARKSLKRLASANINKLVYSNISAN